MKPGLGIAPGVHGGCTPPATARRTRQWRPVQRALWMPLFLLATACMPAAAIGPWRASEANTPGWAVMTPAERVEYQRRMRALESLDACRTFQAEHRARLRERTRLRLRGQPAPPDAEALCLQLQQAGQFR